ncbi:O-antigen ligase family protein [Thiohalobacter sp.]|uniref:O-antigen ligase family protein n=1 Tax=Thiohalobacter sp. TaxID=2025948 RepID=UPI0026137C99|nr:O-antigen ligase family protein [Thiohalobacter sp.]
MSGSQKNGTVLLAWVAMFLNILNWRLRDVVAGQSVGDIWDIYRVGLAFVAGVIAVMTILKNSGRLAYALKAPMLLLLLYGAVALLSSVLVIANVSFYSMWKAIELITVTVVCVAMLAHPNRVPVADKALKYIIWILGGMLCLYLIEAAIWPSEAFTKSRGVIPYIMRGVMPITQQNALAFYSAVVALFCVISLYDKTLAKSRKLIYMALFVVALIELILAQSRTSFVGFFIAVLVFLFVAREFRHLAILSFIAFLGLMVWGASGLLLEYLMRGQEEELVYSLSGRTIGWARALELFKDSPILGHGFVAAARTDILGSIHSGGMSTLHGAFFDVIVGVGLAGLIPWAGAILWVVVRMVRIGRYAEVLRNDELRWKHASMMALLTLIMVRSTTSSGLAIHDHTYMLFLCVLMYAVTISSRIAEHEGRAAEVGLGDAGQELGVRRRVLWAKSNANSTDSQLLSTRRR